MTCVLGVKQFLKSPNGLLKAKLTCNNEFGIQNKLGFTVACKQARTRIRHCVPNNEISWVWTPKLLPLALHQATSAFAIDFEWSDSFHYEISEPNAIFQLLVSFRESFVHLIVDCDQTPRGSMKEEK